MTLIALFNVVVVSAAFGLFVCLLANLVTTIYLHRSLTHESWVITNRIIEFACRFIIWITTGIKPREWVAVHRHHHTMTDYEGDPHSPFIEGLREVLFHNSRLYRQALKSRGSVDDYVRQWASDITTDQWDDRMFDHGLRGLAIGISAATILSFVIWSSAYGVLAGSIFGITGGAVVSLVHTYAYLFLGGCVNGWCHWWGYARFRNFARNLRWVALLTAGEGLHNNHHGRQKSPRLWASWWELPFDWGYWCIWGLRRLGWAKLTGPQANRVLRPKLNLPRSSQEQHQLLANKSAPIAA